MARPRKFRVPLKQGDRVLTEGVIDKHARFAFLHGYCAELAYALHERVGGLVIQIVPAIPVPGFADKTLHAGVVLGVDHLGELTEVTGLRAEDIEVATVLDIEGLHPMKAWAKRWVQPGTQATIAGQIDLNDRMLRKVEECRARSFVDAVLDYWLADHGEAASEQVAQEEQGWAA